MKNIKDKLAKLMAFEKTEPKDKESKSEDKKEMMKKAIKSKLK